MHDTFARNLSHSLGAYLRVMFEATLVSVEQLTYTEFLQRLPEFTYIAAMRLQSPEGRGVVQIDLPIAITIIDLLLGGKGKAEPEQREITEIEEQILESVVTIICRELQATWRPLLEIEFAFDERQQQAQILQMIPPSEKTLSLLFEIRTAEVRGQLNLILPAVVSSALLRKLTQQWTYRKSGGTSKNNRALREHLLDCRFPAELVLPPVAVAARDLLDLQAGKVIDLQHAAEIQAVLVVGGRRLFQARAVRCGNVRAAQLQQRLKPAANSTDDYA